MWLEGSGPGILVAVCFLKLSRKFSATLIDFLPCARLCTSHAQGHGMCSKVTTVQVAGSDTCAREGSCQHGAGHGRSVLDGRQAESYFEGRDPEQEALGSCFLNSN